MKKKSTKKKMPNNASSALSKRNAVEMIRKLGAFVEKTCGNDANGRAPPRTSGGGVPTATKAYVKRHWDQGKSVYDVARALGASEQKNSRGVTYKSGKDRTPYSTVIRILKEKRVSKQDMLSRGEVPYSIRNALERIFS